MASRTFQSWDAQADWGRNGAHCRAPDQRGGASTGQALAALPDEIRLAVRDEVRRDFGDTSGPIEVEAEYRIASGRR
jgi:hypothetical protein